MVDPVRRGLWMTIQQRSWPCGYPDDKHHRFAHVRIHTYGYNANWTERRTSVSNVHEFGYQPLENLRLDVGFLLYQ